MFPNLPANLKSLSEISEHPIQPSPVKADTIPSVIPDPHQYVLIIIYYASI
jgi:hypothetical protein